MGFEEGTERGGLSWGLSSLMRRKQVDSDRVRVEGGHHQLAKELSIPQLIAIGNSQFFENTFCLTILFPISD